MPSVAVFVTLKKILGFASFVLICMGNEMMMMLEVNANQGDSRINSKS